MSSTFLRPAASPDEERGLVAVLAGDGRPLLAIYAVGLGLAGLFAWFLSAVGEALPHELRFLGLTLEQLRGLAGGRVADFMTHDRVAFGGTLIALAVLYSWLVAVPLARGERWAWRLIAATGAFGFASFLAYAGSAYIDGWHATAAVALVLAFVPGLVLTRRGLEPVGSRPAAPAWPSWRTVDGLGRRLVLLAGVGMVVAGSVILALGSIVVFVPQDLVYIGFDRAALDALNAHLVPLIAHDRTGFGGGVATVGLVVLGCLRWARWSRSLWQALLAAGAVGFGAAVGIHGLVGYLDATHVGPAVGARWCSCSGCSSAGREPELPKPARADVDPGDARFGRGAS